MSQKSHKDGIRSGSKVVIRIEATGELIEGWFRGFEASRKGLSYQIEREDGTIQMVPLLDVDHVAIRRAEDG